MNQNNNTSQNGSTNQANREPAKMITLTAFLIGYLLIDNLNSNEQSALGNFFMLIGQTLCTSGSENFKRDWSPYANPTNFPPNGNNSANNTTFSPENLQTANGYSKDNFSSSNGQTMTREQTIDMLNRARNIFNQEIDKLK